MTQEGKPQADSKARRTSRARTQAKLQARKPSTGTKARRTPRVRKQAKLQARLVKSPALLVSYRFRSLSGIYALVFFCTQTEQRRLMALGGRADRAAEKLSGI